jgi:aminoglycoside phosphotransferase (APT) family kinase protein
MVFAGDGCAGLLDWELVSIGDPAQDLAWWNFSEHMFDRLLGSQAPEGCLAGDALLATYEELSGTPPSNYRYYEIFNALRALAIYERSIAIQRAQGRDVPPGMGAGDNFVTAALTAMLDRAGAD